MEDFDLKPEENTQSLTCVVCNWPINRLLNVKKIYPKILEWINENSNGNERNEVLKNLEFLGRVDKLAICRYDFFDLIKNIISRSSEELAKKFERFEKQYDFSGSLIS